MNLFRKPFETDEYGVRNPENVGDNLPETDNVGEKLSAKERRIQIVNVMSKDSDVTASQLAEKFFVTTRTIERDIERLRKENKIPRDGSDISGKWIVD